jgi:hypothetical protein
MRKNKEVRRAIGAGLGDVTQNAVDLETAIGPASRALKRLRPKEGAE